MAHDQKQLLHRAATSNELHVEPGDCASLQDAPNSGIALHSPVGCFSTLNRSCWSGERGLHLFFPGSRLLGINTIESTGTFYPRHIR